MQKLIQGIHHFQRNTFHAQRELFERLATQQQPDVLFITCADSRINPNLMTNTAPGELFVLRNAGNIIPPHGAPGGGEAATVEFAVTGLGVKDIVLCGHSNCGAVKGLLDPAAAAGMPAVASWLAYAESTRRIIQENYRDLPADRLLSAAVEENVLVQLENLCTLPCVAARLARGDLNLHGWVYKIETGEVFAYEPEAGQFVAITPAYLPSARPPARSGVRRIL
jgi:carbonic anhydrase